MGPSASEFRKKLDALIGLPTGRLRQADRRAGPGEPVDDSALGPCTRRHEPGPSRPRFRREVEVRRYRVSSGHAPDMDDARSQAGGDRRSWWCSDRDGQEPGGVHRGSRLHRHRGDEFGVRDRKLSAPRRCHFGDAGVRRQLRRGEDFTGHWSFHHLVVDLHRSERREKYSAASGSGSSHSKANGR